MSLVYVYMTGFHSNMNFLFELARCFPLLESLIIANPKAQSTDSAKSEHDNNGSFEIVQYLHLTSLTLVVYILIMLNKC